MKKISYEKAIELANQHKRIYQYTTYESLEKIITNRALRFTRIDLLNDYIENQKILELWKNKVYVSCFTHREHESFFFWETYAKKSYDGVMLSFEQKYLSNLTFHTDEKCEDSKLDDCNKSDTTILPDLNISNTSWGIFDYSSVDIIYIPRGTTFEKDDHFLGRIKHQEWDMEFETRLRLAVKPRFFEVYSEKNKFKYYAPNNKYIYAKLSECCLKSMTITLSPYASISVKHKIERLLKSNKLDNDIAIIESVLTGEVEL